MGDKIESKKLAQESANGDHRAGQSDRCVTEYRIDAKKIAKEIGYPVMIKAAAAAAARACAWPTTKKN